MSHYYYPGGGGGGGWGWVEIIRIKAVLSSNWTGLELSLAKKFPMFLMFSDLKECKEDKSISFRNITN